MNRRALLIGAGALLLIVLAWYFLLWSPRSRALTQAQDRTNAALAQQEQLKTQIQRLRAAQRQEPLKRARLETLRTAIPDDPAIGQLILDVNNAANQSGIEFLSIAPAVPASGTIRLSISINGGYFQVLDFINRLNALTRVIVVDGVTLAPGGGGRMSSAITGRTFTAGTTGATTTTTAPGAAATTTTTAAA